MTDETILTNALLVLPDGRTPLEQYRILHDAKEAGAGDIFTDRTPRRQTFEGFYDWMVASSAMAASIRMG